MLKRLNWSLLRAMSEPYQGSWFSSCANWININLIPMWWFSQWMYSLANASDYAFQMGWQHTLRRIADFWQTVSVAFFCEILLSVNKRCWDKCSFIISFDRSHVCPWLRGVWDHGVGSAAAVETGPRMVWSSSTAQTWTQSCGYQGTYGGLWWWKRRNCGWITCIQHW